MMNRLISVVVPIFNEEEILEEKVKFLQAELKGRFDRYEIILSENGSSDQTKEIARAIAGKSKNLSVIIDDIPPDYGMALIKGIKASREENIAILELDYLDLDFLMRAYAMLEDHDLIIGSKKLSPGIDQRPFKRKLFTWLYNFMVRRMFSLKLSETHGLKVMHKSAIVPIMETCITRQAVFPTELVIRASRDPKIKVAEIPLSLPLREIRKTRIQALKRLRKTIDDLMTLKRALK
jgi:glycosyltransferase involved in cell wall biosynthesis